LKVLRYFYDKFIFPIKLNKYFDLKTNEIYNDLLISQYKNLTEIQVEQETLFNEILKFASKNSKYYSNKFGKYINIHLDQCNKIPYLTKKDIIENFNNIYNKFSPKEFEHITSGSTGQPLKIISSNISEAHRTAQRLRFFSWWDINPSDANVLVWGRMDKNIQIKNSIYDRFKQLFKGSTYNINVFDLNGKTIGIYYRDILKLRPKYIRGYTSAIFQFAHLLDQKGLDGNKLGLKVAITTSEVLQNEQKEYIEKVLNVRVADEYGAAEIGLFAYSCPANNKHICEELLYIYANEDNEIIATDLHNYSMPLINYKIGDKIFISDKPCECGRTSRVIEKIEGRTGDFILADNGELLSQYLFYYAVKDLDKIGLANSIIQYKVIQQEMKFDFYIVKGNNFKVEVEEYLRNRMFNKIGKSIEVNFKYVPEIPKENSGKVRFFLRNN